MKARRAARTVGLAVGCVLAVGATAAQEIWSPARTPWGDPDLQGNYTNKYEQGTPFERPAEFDGRRLEDIRGDELATLVKDRADWVLLNSPFSGGDPRAGNLGGSPVFYDRYEADKGSRPWFVTDPPDGQIPPMTAAARAGAARAGGGGRFGGADSYEDRSLYDRCITRGLPGSMMPTNYGNSYRIVQGPGYVAIGYEMVHETRIIPLDAAASEAGARRLSPRIRQFMGAARGYWDGDTLVVETTNVLEGYRGANPETVRYVERFTPTSPAHLEWSFTVVDPSTWERPWTFSMPLTRDDKEAVLEYACHEGNRAMEHLLSAGRAADLADGVLSSRAADDPFAQLDIAASAASPLDGFAGVWVLDGVDGGGGGRGFAGFSTANTLAIRPDGPAHVAVDSDTGTLGLLQTARYPLDGAREAVPGPLGWETQASATLDEGALEVRISRSILGPDAAPIVFEIVDRYRVAVDRLTLERRQGERTQTMTYRRRR